MSINKLHDFYFSQSMADNEDQFGLVNMDGSPSHPFICMINGHRYTYACNHGKQPTANYNDLEFITTAKIEDVKQIKRGKK